ncbi:MAG: DUF3052 domain-containing protein [Candidatus Kerfeldbacteria bacterium]|nr:DUF3052 domain-containing protein [Candidatus Kerfeldbacteria bacterium]
MAGYSKKKLADKLGLTPGFRACVVQPPPGYRRLLGMKFPHKLASSCDFIQYFSKDEHELRAAFPRLKRSLKKEGMLWVSWPKQSSGVKTDLRENVVMKVGLAHGLVDVKVAAIDETWSGLKFVWRVKDR